MTYKEFCKQEFGYDVISTFFEDFSIAEAFGHEEIKETYRRVFKEWRHDYKMFTELVMVLNHKIWFTYEDNEPLGRLYDYLWKKADAWGKEHLKGEELEYFYTTLD